MKLQTGTNSLSWPAAFPHYAGRGVTWHSGVTCGCKALNSAFIELGKKFPFLWHSHWLFKVASPGCGRSNSDNHSAFCCGSVQLTSNLHCGIHCRAQMLHGEVEEEQPGLLPPRWSLLSGSACRSGGKLLQGFLRWFSSCHLQTPGGLRGHRAC